MIPSWTRQHFSVNTSHFASMSLQFYMLDLATLSAPACRRHSLHKRAAVFKTDRDNNMQS